ncbi:MAG: hypothetical protein ACK5LY_02805 [Lachnospirales bacterium]
MKKFLCVLAMVSVLFTVSCSSTSLDEAVNEVSELASTEGTAVNDAVNEVADAVNSEEASSLVEDAVDLVGEAVGIDADFTHGQEVSQANLDKFNAGAAVSYEEIYVDGSGSFAYKRDADGNVYVKLTGTVVNEYYKIGDTYYDYEDGVLVLESADDEGYIDSITTTMAEEISFIGVETYVENLDAVYTEENGMYVVEGVYDDESTYTVQVAVDGSTMSLVDSNVNETVDFNFTDKIVLPQ